MSNKKSPATRNQKIVNILVKVLKISLLPLGMQKRETVLSILSESAVPVTLTRTHKNKEMRFWGFGGWPLYRGRSVLTKEPLTIEWIDSFTPGAVFWDIGANVGVYSVYAATRHEDITIFSFEPSAINQAVLNKNIELNGADKKVTALPLAFNDKTQIDYFYMDATAAGNTGGQFSQEQAGQEQAFRQSCLGFSVDHFVEFYKTDVPNYIKIDVDGIEHLILRGATATLRNTALKSIILEADTDSPEYKEIEDILSASGFEKTQSENTVAGREQPCNMIFSRQP